MKELRGTEWYGEYATLTDEHNDYIQIEYKCNGTGCLYDYALFPGIDLIFMDFNCPDTFHEPIPNKNIIEIRHYQKGRVEFELRKGTTNSLLDIGVGNNVDQAIRDYGVLPQVSKGWTENNAFFKGEGTQTNFGLGKGKALEIFNSNIINFKRTGGK